MRIDSKTCVKLSLAVPAFAGAFALSTAAEAAPRTHDGFYLHANTGLGYLSSSVEAMGRKESLSGVSFPFAFLLGGTVGPVALGGGFFGDRAYSPTYKVNGQELPLGGDFSMTLIGLGVFADIYPDPQQGLHFQPFVGWGGLERTINGNSGGSDPTGLVLSLAGGYDFFVSDEWSIGPMLRFAYAPLKMNDFSFPTIAPALLVNFTYH
jgi:hypothetical protein